MNTKANSAILFFSRTAAEEAGVKTFNPKLGLKANTAISKCLIQKVISVSRKSKLPLFTCFSADQTGSDFGERLANAIESVYSKGFDNVIVIGNDCPFITSSMLLEVNDRLQNEKLILGPAFDGGVYLIGLHKSAYTRKNFLNLPWQQVNLQEGWKLYALNLESKVNWLEVHFDIDQAIDFNKFLNLLPKNDFLRKRLLNIIKSFNSNCLFESVVFYKKEKYLNLALRAPPSKVAHHLFAA